MSTKTASSMNGLQAPPTNAELAQRLDTVGDLLEAQGANRFRYQAYQRAAEMLQHLEQPAWQIYESHGIEGLDKLPGVGRSISRALQQMIRGGRWPLLERLQGNDVTEQAFASVPSIGAKLAKRIHEELGIETLVELQAAAWDGRLQKLPGFGEKRIRAVRESLAARGRRETSFVGNDTVDLTSEIAISELLDIDNEYRLKSNQQTLPRIAPRRFNPTASAWLPVLHTVRGDRHYTALFSNTARAHEMGTTHDWVVIYLEEHHQGGQNGRWTVITSQFGKLRGRRIVRGRERECAEYYEQRSD
jgi:DNA polymerase (family 10)